MYTYYEVHRRFPIAHELALGPKRKNDILAVGYQKAKWWRWEVSAFCMIAWLPGAECMWPDSVKSVFASSIIASRMQPTQPTRKKCNRNEYEY